MRLLARAQFGGLVPIRRDADCLIIRSSMLLENSIVINIGT